MGTRARPGLAGLQPNILLIHSDQHRYDCLGVNGHPLVQTPNLDRLAAGGVSFSHAFCPTPLCTPSRTSLLTGMWPSQHGCIANKGTEAYHPIDESVPTFSQALKAQGYYLGYVGKWQVGANGGPTDYGFDDFVPDTAYMVWRKEQGLPPVPTHNGWFGEVDPGIRADQSGLAWGATQAMRLLMTAGRGERPFFIRWDPREPHLPNIVPEPYASMYVPAQIPPWPSYPDPLAGKPYIQKQQRRTWGVEQWTWRDWAPVVARYLGDVSLLDHQVGRLLATLDDLGLARDTLVIYTTDHGDLCGGHGMLDKHFVMYEDLVHVPLIVRWPGQVTAGGRCDAFVSSALDVAATFCHAANAPIPASFQGRSLLTTLTEPPDAGRKDIFAAYYGNQFGLYSQRMVRERRWKYIWNATAEDELYDLAADPGEIVNLAGVVEYGGELQRLRLRLAEWMQETHDRLLNPWIKRQLSQPNAKV